MNQHKHQQMKNPNSTVPISESTPVTTLERERLTEEWLENDQRNTKE